jgi:hypothetical protein
MSKDQLVDYTVEAFILPIVRNGIKVYASINTEMYWHFDEEEIELPSDGLDVSGNYHVYLLHPRHGSANFIVEPDNSYTGFKKLGGPIWLTDEDDILQEIFEAIQARKSSR